MTLIVWVLSRMSRYFCVTPGTLNLRVTFFDYTLFMPLAQHTNTHYCITRFVLKRIKSVFEDIFYTYILDLKRK